MRPCIFAAALAAILCAHAAQAREPSLFVFPMRLGDYDALAVFNDAKEDTQPVLEFTCTRSLGEQTFRVRFPKPGEAFAIRCPTADDMQPLTCANGAAGAAHVRPPVPWVRSKAVTCFPPAEQNLWFPRIIPWWDTGWALSVVHVRYVTATALEKKEAAR